MANTVLAKMAVEISANTAKFGQSLNRVENQFKSFTGSLSNLAGTIGIAFGTQQVASFAFEVSKLAGEAEGVRAAFDKLPESQKLMEDLKEATAGTVSELDLMKRTVQASNFGIALESLPDLLKFASLRAQQTGQSVDYLVDSIVTGIGRKSPLILDNLGISAVRLKEQFGGAALEAQSIGDVAKAVGRIASEELGKMGEFSENTSTKIQRLTANFENLKVALGASGNSTGVFTGALDLLNDTLVNFTSFLKGPASSALTNYLKLASIVPATTLKIANAAFKFFGDKSGDEALKNQALQLERFNNFAKRNGYDDLSKAAEQYRTDLYKALLVQQAFLDDNKKFAAVNPIEGKTLIEGTQAEIEELNKAISFMAEYQKELVKTEEANKKLGQTYDDLQKKLADLNDQFETATQINDRKKLASIGQEIIATKALIAQLDDLREARDKVIRASEGTVFGGLQKQINKPISEALDFSPTTTNKSFGIAEELPLNNETMLNRIKENLMKLQVINSTTTEKIKGQWVDLSSVVGGAISDLAYSFGQAAAGVGSFGDSILKSLINFAKQFGEILIATGTAALAAKLLIKNPATAIAAGVALLAVAGAASAALGKAQANYNSGGGGDSSGRVSDRRGSIGALNAQGREIEITGEFKLSGDVAKAVVKRAEQKQQRTRLDGPNKIG